MRISEKIDLWRIIHILIGGIICFGSISILEGYKVIWMVVEWIFKSYGSLGVFIFEEAQNGYYIIRLGSVYLSSGFLGGLYLGYKVKNGLKVNMAFPTIISFTFLAGMGYFTGYWGAINLDSVLRGIFIPMLIAIAGSYLGGYTLNWHIEEKPKEEKIILLFKR